MNKYLMKLKNERQDLIELCHSLTLEEWYVPSFFEGWTVRDTVIHIIGIQKDIVEYIRHPATANQNQIDRRKNFTLENILKELEEVTYQKPNFVIKLMAKSFLYETWVHQQDIRWAIGKNRVHDQGTLKFLLNYAAKKYSKKMVANNQKLICTDLDWSIGIGANIISAPSEILIMYMSGREKSALMRL